MATAIPSTMRAITQATYGPPTTALHLRTTPVPTPLPHQLLLRVHATSPHKGDSHIIRGTPAIIRPLFGGFFRPSVNPGTDCAGAVVAVGETVRGRAVGDRVFADLSGSSFGAFAEYAVVDAEHAAAVPAGLSFRLAAPLGVSAVAALQAVRDFARVSQGMTVLVTGASGGVGSFAVQIARALGGSVTAACRKRKMAMVSTLGAEAVVDSESEDFLSGGERFDAVIDTAMYRSPMDYVGVLKEGGRYVAVGGEVKYMFMMMLGLGMWMTKVKKRPASFLDSKPNREDLEAVRDLVEQGKVVPLIDEERFGLEDIPRAVEKIENRNVCGKIVVDVVRE